jgi:hypothetical protein
MCVARCMWCAAHGMASVSHSCMPVRSKCQGIEAICQSRSWFCHKTHYMWCVVQGMAWCWLQVLSIPSRTSTQQTTHTASLAQAALPAGWMTLLDCLLACHVLLLITTRAHRRSMPRRRLQLCKLVPGALRPATATPFFSTSSHLVPLHIQL